MVKPLTHGFSREIFLVSFGENGERIEKDYDLLSEEEKKEFGRKVNRKGMMAAGYVPVVPEGKRHA